MGRGIFKIQREFEITFFWFPRGNWSNIFCKQNMPLKKSKIPLSKSKKRHGLMITLLTFRCFLVTLQGPCRKNKWSDVFRPPLQSQEPPLPDQARVATHYHASNTVFDQVGIHIGNKSNSLDDGVPTLWRDMYRSPPWTPHLTAFAFLRRRLHKMYGKW